MITSKAVQYIEESKVDAQTLLLDTFEHHKDKIIEFIDLAVYVLAQGNKILLFGNGGSAAEAQHIAAELVGKFEMNRNPLPAIALTTDTSALTAIANDWQYDRVFERQIQALGVEGDMALGLTTSGDSHNVFLALATARDKGLHPAALTGLTGGKIKDIADPLLCIPSINTARIQEMHQLILHMMCGAIEIDLFANG